MIYLFSNNLFLFPIFSRSFCVQFLIFSSCCSVPFSFSLSLSFSFCFFGPEAKKEEKKTERNQGKERRKNKKIKKDEERKKTKQQKNKFFFCFLGCSGETRTATKDERVGKSTPHLDKQTATQCRGRVPNVATCVPSHVTWLAL